MKKPGMSKRVAGIGDAAVIAATGKTWSQWLKALDAAGARKMAPQSLGRPESARGVARPARADCPQGHAE
jgi:hypothetical protein